MRGVRKRAIDDGQEVDLKLREGSRMTKWHMVVVGDTRGAASLVGVRV